MFKDQEYRDTRKLMLDKELQTINTNHFDIMKTIEGVEPKFAKHMFLRNQLIENFAKSIGGGINVLGQPMCNHCEKVAAWNDEGTAYCFSCHSTTKKPITVKQYLIEYTKALSEEQLELLSMMGGVEDEVDK